MMTYIWIGSRRQGETVSSCEQVFICPVALLGTGQQIRASIVAGSHPFALTLGRPTLQGLDKAPLLDVARHV